jgi:hypothetical protein
MVFGPLTNRPDNYVRRLLDECERLRGSVRELEEYALSLRRDNEALRDGHAEMARYAKTVERYAKTLEMERAAWLDREAA